MTTSTSKRILGLVVAILLAPPTVIFGAIAAFYLARQFVSGWIPSRWFSDSPLDWVFGMGVEGSATNYVGFMLAGVPAIMCGSGVLWGYDAFRGKKN
jgi:ABC-type phosphate transport system permease subunit